MSGKYEQWELNTYGAEDDEELDTILDAIDRADADDEKQADT
jgi:hypothetical protein